MPAAKGGGKFSYTEQAEADRTTFPIVRRVVVGEIAPGGGEALMEAAALRVIADYIDANQDGTGVGGEYGFDGPHVSLQVTVDRHDA